MSNTEENQMPQLCISMGMCMGILSKPENFNALVATMQDGSLYTGYVRALRDKLSLALNELDTLADTCGPCATS